VQDVEDELVVYDKTRHRVHCLNRTAVLVWRLCDGRTAVADMARRLRDETDLPADESLIWLTLERLGKAQLLRERVTRPTDPTLLSRRQWVRKLGRAGAVLLPLVTSLTAPTPAMAASGSGQGTSGSDYSGGAQIFQDW